MTKDNNKLNTNKRNFIKGFTALVGAAAASQLLTSHSVSAAMAYKDNPSGSEPKLFSAAEMSLLKVICNAVIPATETPGAGDLNVQRFVNHQLYHCYKEPEQQRMKALVNKIEANAVAQFAQSFNQSTQQQQISILSDLESRQRGATEQDRNDIKLIKYLIVFGYYTSEIGATQELAYQAVPGGYKGSVPLSELGKAWGSLDYY